MSLQSNFTLRTLISSQPSSCRLQHQPAVLASPLILSSIDEIVTQVQLNHAKEATKSAVLMNLESRMIASEDIGRQILTYGERYAMSRWRPVKHFLKAVEEITLKDITTVAQKIISSPLTIASYGDVINVPSYESVSSKFHAK